MDAMLTIEMTPEHAVVIALALDGYIKRNEFEMVVAPHEVDETESETVEIARWMREQLRKMFYELAKSQLEHEREELPDELVDALEQIVRMEEGK